MSAMSSTSPCRPETFVGPTTATGRLLETRSRTSSPPSIWCRQAVIGVEPSWTSSSRTRGTSPRSATWSGTRGTRFASRKRRRSPSPPPASSRPFSQSHTSAASDRFQARRSCLTVSSTRDSCQPNSATSPCHRALPAGPTGAPSKMPSTVAPGGAMSATAVPTQTGSPAGDVLSALVFSGPGACRRPCAARAKNPW